MPATRSRTSTEAPEVAVEEVKKIDDSQPNEEVKESSNKEQSDESCESTTNEKDENNADSEENGSNDVSEVKDANGDQTEEKVENGSSKRKSEAGEGDGPDSTDITPKKVKLDDNESSEAVNAADGELPQLEATV